MKLLLLLMVLLPYGHGVTNDRSLFKKINESDPKNPVFPFLYELETDTDMVIVRCPGTGFKYEGKNVGFVQSDEASEQEISGLGKDNGKSVWKVATTRKSTDNEITFNCGKLIGSTFLSKEYEWDLKLVYKNQSTPLKVEPKNLDSRDMKRPSNCTDLNDMKYIIKYNSGSQASYDHLSVEIFRNSLIYVFDEKKITEYKLDTLEPCGVIKVIGNFPAIEMTVPDSTRKIETFGETNVQIFSKDNKIYEIGVQLTLIPKRNTKYKDFYKYETVSAVHKRLDKDKKFVNNGDINVVENKIAATDFGIFEISFKCEECPDIQEKAELVFVGPKIATENKPPKIKYIIGKAKIYRRCSILYETYGIIKSVSFGTDKATYDELKPDKEKNNFKIDGDYVLYKNEGNHIGTLLCNYEFPGGIVSKEQEYHGFPKNNVLVEKGGNIYSDDPRYSVIKGSRHNAGKPGDTKKMPVAKIIAIVAVPIVVIIIILIILAYLNKKRLMNKMIGRNLARNNPHVYKFWSLIQDVPFIEISNLLDNLKYTPKRPSKKVVEEDKGNHDMGEELDMSMYDTTLVKPQDGKTTFAFRAHTIHSDFQKRKYILSECPTKENFASFWNMIINEGVKAIVAIIYQSENDTKEKYQQYWPVDTAKYGDIVVKNLGIKESNVLLAKIYNLQIDDKGVIKTIPFYLIGGWKNGGIPDSPSELVELYNSISECADNGSVLIHSSSQPGSRTFLFTFFGAIVETLENGRNIDEEDQWNGMLIMKRVREQIYGGALSGLEFAYLVISIIEYFVKKKILFEDDKIFYFHKCFNDYVHELKLKEASCVSPIKSFLLYVNSLDKGKIEALSVTFDTLNAKKILETECELFNEIEDIQRDLEELAKEKYVANKKKELNLKPDDKVPFPSMMFREKYFAIRWLDIPCLDANTVLGYDSTSSKDRFKDFMNANEFTYKLNKFERKMIMCQAPLVNRSPRTYDIVFKQKVSGIIILCRNDELKIKKWQKYYPEKKGEVVIMGEYIVKNVDGMLSNGSGSAFGKFNLSRKSNPNETIHTFHIVHFLHWEDHGVPKNISEFLNLCKLIDSLCKKEKLMIHCSAGIGRTGSLVLFLYLVDILDAGQFFDIKNALIDIRKCRAKAVQRPEQFLMVLSALIHYYKNDLDKFGLGIFEKSQSLIGMQIDSCVKKKEDGEKKKVPVIQKTKSLETKTS
uniref:Tyrosine-protein phosphatase domain-containing protein n=1 Tax=Parastrongyloides trichosuri TaxID=131310 RepID=A0A0N5A2D9_PARTI